MTKYIDADRLKAEIERKIHEISHPLKDGYEVQSIGKIEGLSELLEIIDSLQQEQLVKSELKEEKIECSPVMKELIGKLFEVGHAYNFGFGPKDFLQEQPEVDLKKEIKEWTDLMVGASFPEQDGDFISEEDYRSVIRQTAIHFLGLNARK